MKSWVTRIDWEIVLAIAVVAALLILLMVLLVMPLQAASCLTVDVPPQAVIGQPDGDTFYVFNLFPPGNVKIRVQGIDTPEISRKKGVPDEPLAKEAREFTRRWLALGTFRMTTCGKHTIDRIEAVVERDGKTLADALRSAGFQKP